MSQIELKVGRTYRAKKPANANGLYNDRTIVWMSPPIGLVQYDGPAVAMGRLLPKVDAEKFLAWAGRDVTDELPDGEYQECESAK